MPTETASARVSSPSASPRYCFALYALIALLAACQPAEKVSAQSTAPDSQAAASSTPASTATAPETAVIDTDEDDALTKPKPDASYTDATLRPSYTQCVNATNGNTFDLKACGDAELAYQEEQLANVVEPVIDSPDSVEKDKWLEEQAAWWVETKRNCAFDPATEGQGQMLDALSCRINRVANRVEELKSRPSNP